MRQLENTKEEGVGIQANSVTPGGTKRQGSVELICTEGGGILIYK
jgi:hypothetical protein